MSNPRLNAVDQPNFPIVLAMSAAAVSCPVDTSEDILANIPIPAGVMGLNGVLRVTTFWSCTNSVNNKTLRIRFGGLGGTSYLGVIVTTSATYTDIRQIANRVAANSQVGSAQNSAAGASAATIQVGAVDTSAPTTLVITGQKALGSEALTLESYLIELIPG